MRLAKVTISGFKSFADPVEIRFDDPKVGIVGPNGCGKSNIVDAIKWVLGERSAKSLRGDAMLDVIFAGSAGRKPLGAASVTLSFTNPVTNPGSQDPAQRRLLAVDTDTVDVGRRLYRDGRSEYLINGKACRLRDVKELFMDTGIGVNAYSIIEQGKVSAMLNGSPIERRTIVEEAAGVAKFKTRKVEAARKLERSEVNLVRVREQLASTERRLRIVKGQAVKARKFKELDGRYRSLRTELALDQYHELQERLSGLTSRLSDLELQCRQVEQRLVELDESAQQAELDRHEQQERRQELERQLQSNDSASRQAAQRREMTSNRLEELKTQLAVDAERVKEFEHRLRSQEDDQQTASDAMAAAAEQLAETERRVDDSSRDVARLHQESELAERRIEATRSERDRLLARRSHVQSTSTAIEGRVREIEEQLERLGQRRASLVEERTLLERDRIENDKALESAQCVVRRLESELSSHDDEAANLSEQHADMTEHLASVRHDRAGIGSRLHLLEEMQDAREGLTDHVKRILSNSEQWPGIEGMLGDALTTSRDNARLVEAVLGHDLELLLVSDENTLQELSGQLLESNYQVNLHVRNGEPPAVDRSDLPEGALPILDLVQVEAQALGAAHDLLGYTAVVDDLETALACGTSSWRLVTRTGLVLDTNGCIRVRGASAGGEHGWLSRRLEMEDLGGQVDQLDGNISSMTNDLAELLSESTQARDKQKQTGRLLAEELNAVAELEYNHRRFDRDLERIVREQRTIDAEKDELNSRRNEHADELVSIKEELARMDCESANCDERIAETETASQSITSQWKQSQEDLTAQRVELGQISELYEAKQRERSHLAILAEETGGELIRQRHHVNTQMASVDQHEAAIATADEEIATSRQNTARSRAEIHSADQTVSRSETSLTELREQLEAARNKARQLDRDRNALEISKREAEVKRENTEERVLADLEIDLLSAWKRVADQRRANPQEPLDHDVVEEEIAELRDTIKGLGNVNLDSIEEETTLEERNEDLVKQVEDIDLAVTQLGGLIEDLDVKCRNRFEKAFNEIREQFAGSNGMFRQLFNGGSADLFLQPDEDGNVDILESGIEITAKPPGKKPRVLNQLSGGEKAMTSVALVMAIFKSKPSPFCILDEVDAPLDDANVSRFCSTLDQFLDKSHFIVITHQKQTMLNCDALYGITMQERGVSKLVNVEVEDVGLDGSIRRSTETSAPATVEEEDPPAMIVTNPAASAASTPAKAN
ncbi:MAG: chromosome segregation protein SMC [Planctomycetota bacterium]|nr:chromosome segregation protein SMC [Planctomycetota bacterium]